jgi:hypothetical protein
MVITSVYRFISTNISNNIMPKSYWLDGPAAEIRKYSKNSSQFGPIKTFITVRN